MILPLVNFLLIVAIAVVGISSFFLPGTGILARKAASPDEEQVLAQKRRRAIWISLGVIGALVVILLFLLGSGSLSGAAGGGPQVPSEDEAFTLDTSFVIATAIGMVLLGGVGIGALLAIALGAFIMLKAPSRIRKIIGFSAAILTGLLVLSIASYVFNWGWNFPDIFGTVGGILSLVFLINDRYLSKQS